MADEYDLVVIGAGSGGLSAAPFAAQLGAKVALVEKDRVGGDCLWTGCVPSKAFIKAAKVAWEMRTADHYGIEAVQPRVELGSVMAHVKQVVERVYAFESPRSLEEEGIEVVLSGARFLDAHSIAVGDRVLRAKVFLVCTGGTAMIPAIPGIETTPYLTYETIFDETELPGRLLVVGAGPIGLELGQAFHRLGAQVTIFQRSARLLSMGDPDVSRVIAEALTAEGIRLQLGAPLERVAQVNGHVEITAGGRTFSGDKLLIALGRRPNVDLDLERAGVHYDAKGIPVDEALRTNVKHIYACGDVIGSHQFTHYAGWQGYIAVRNALLPLTSNGLREQVPWTIFTDPEVARAGLTEGGARERYGDDVRVATWPLERIDRAQAEEDRLGFIKIVYRSNEEIVGAHIVAGRAGEIIHEFIMAIEKRIKLSELAGMIHVYPTYSTGNQQIAAVHVVHDFLASRKGQIIQKFARWLR
ncbi:MAG: FAD-dependent oxidoreductase [Chloroflexi bacterium]|nr:FAD-dependent oxidoreductase [Chloroflexota bacterium]